MRTIFIGQNACETSATDDINAKIGNLVDSGGDLGNFDSANASLTALINSLTPNRATGSLSKLRNEITRYERIVQDGQGLSDALDDCRSRLAAGEEKYSALKEKRIEAGAVQDKVSRQQSLIAKKSELMRLHDTVEERTHQVDAIRVKFPGEVPEPDEIKQELFSCSEMDKAHERVVLYQMSDEENE
jgi:hypothetical protein